MTKFFNILLLTFLITKLFGQTTFIAEGRQIKTGVYTKTYNFVYQFPDSLLLILNDSTETFYNLDSTILKSITYSTHNEKPYTRIEYFRTNKEDSICKCFNGDNLSCIYETRFDSLNRIVYYALKYIIADSTNHPGFIRTYEYRDSITNTERISIQTIFSVDYFGKKEFFFRVLSIFDLKNRKIKEIRETKTNDPWAQITTYIYDKGDKLIKERIYTAGMIQTFSMLENKHINTKCDQESETVFIKTDYLEIEKYIRKLLYEKRKILNCNKCVNYFYSLISPDKQTILTIIKKEPYYEGRNVIFMTTKILN